MTTHGFDGARAARTCATGHGEIHQGMRVTGRDKRAGFGQTLMERAMKRGLCMNENEVGGGSEFGGEGGEIAEVQFDFGGEGVERIAGREQEGGGSARVDGAGGERKQNCRIRIGDEEDSGSGREVGERRADWANYVDDVSRRENAQSGVGRREIDGETGLGNERGEERLAKIGVESVSEAGEGELAGGQSQIGVKVGANPVADEFELGAMGGGLAHLAMITRFKCRPCKTVMAI